jgi:hypothetical protein
LKPAPEREHARLLRRLFFIVKKCKYKKGLGNAHPALGSTVL